MNAATSLKDYGHYGATGLRAERDIEYDAFSLVTRMLQDAGTGEIGAVLVAAVHKNTELWTILAADLAQPGNRLPPETRAGLISLAGFSIRHGMAVLNGSANAQALIDINVAIMKGLRGEVAE